MRHLSNDVMNEYWMRRSTRHALPGRTLDNWARSYLLANRGM
jgi:hypothetical protein